MFCRWLFSTLQDITVEVLGSKHDYKSSMLLKFISLCFLRSHMFPRDFSELAVSADALCWSWACSAPAHPWCLAHPAHRPSPGDNDPCFIQRSMSEQDFLSNSSISTPGCHGPEARKHLSPLLLILLPLAQRSKEGKEVSLFECQTEISSSKDKQYGGRKRRALGDRRAGDSRDKRGQGSLERIGRWRTACNQYSTLLSWNLEQEPALAGLCIPLQPATCPPSGGGDGMGLAGGRHDHWSMDIPSGFCSSVLATKPCGHLLHPWWKLVWGPWGSAEECYCCYVLWRGREGREAGGRCTHQYSANPVQWQRCC